MTPALLDDLVRAAACEVLAVRGLDLAALPADAGVERPRNPAHGEYATSVALRTAGRVGVAPRELAGWLADALVRRPEDVTVKVGTGSWQGALGSRSCRCNPSPPHHVPVRGRRSAIQQAWGVRVIVAASDALTTHSSGLCTQNWIHPGTGMTG